MKLCTNKREVFKFLCRPEMADFWRDLDGNHIEPLSVFSEVPSTILFDGHVAFMFNVPWPTNDVVYSQVHFAADEFSRGKYAVERGKEALKWYKENNDVDKIICSVFTDRPNHERFCEKLGMVEYGKSHKYTNFEVM